MFLYEKEGKDMKVYSLKKDEQALREYRMNQMKQIRAGRRCFYTTEVVESLRDDPTLLRRNFETDITPYSELVDKLRYNTDKEDCDALLREYYRGDYTNRSVAVIDYYKKLRYLLMVTISPRYAGYPRKNTLCIDDLVELPESLYFLQLLERGKYNLLAEKDVSEQLQYFDFHFVDSFNEQELQKMIKCGILSNETLQETLDSNQQAVQFLKSRKNL